jgi:hypothetical protein
LRRPGSHEEVADLNIAPETIPVADHPILALMSPFARLRNIRVLKHPLARVKGIRERQT